MKTLATSLVTVQEISEHLKAGLALENLHGEYFYVNDIWPRFHAASDTNGTISSIYPPELLREIKMADNEILNKKAPVGYLITEGATDGQSSVHLVLKFAINYTTGEPFCFCMLAKKLDDHTQFQSIVDKLRQLMPMSLETEFKQLNHAIC